MKIIVCLDNSDGMLFNNRRQSRDQKIIDDIENFIMDDFLFMTPFSWSLLENTNINLAVGDNFSNQDTDDYCFVENQHLKVLEDKIDEIVIYKWNRNYPADFYFDIDYKKDFKLIHSEDFEGNSHDLITKEIYKKWKEKKSKYIT